MKVLRLCVFFIFIVVFKAENGGTNVIRAPNSTMQFFKFPKIPKCCESRKEGMLLTNKTCIQLDEEPIYDHYLLSEESDGPIKFSPEFYTYRPNCQHYYSLYDDEVLGIDYNGSIIAPNYTFSSTEYCVNSADYKITFMVCTEPIPISISVLASVLCYCIITIICIVTGRKDDTHKKCFIGYSTSMGVTFMSMILLQQIDGGCVYFGSIFLFSIISSIIWLCCFCIDTAYIIRSFSDTFPERINWYIGAATLIPALTLITSLIPSQIPDVPLSFTQGFRCNGKEPRNYILFVPLVLSLLVSLGALSYTIHGIKRNFKYKSELNLFQKRTDVKYVTGSGCFIWAVTAIWIVTAIVLNMDIGDRSLYNYFEGFQGIFVIIIFIHNRCR